MPEAWRIVKARHASAAFSGKGAAAHGGRWNSRGVSVVYTSGSKSLAALESLVQLNPAVHFKYVAIRVEFEDAIMEEISLKKLPLDWQVEPPAASTQQIGDDWVREARSAVLLLPSVIIPSEPNYLLNPAHPSFKRISIGKPEKFTFDPRLLT